MKSTALSATANDNKFTDYKDLHNLPWLSSHDRQDSTQIGHWKLFLLADGQAIIEGLKQIKA